MSLVVCVAREDLLKAFGYFALVPFGADEDCAPKAQAILSCVDALVAGATFDEWHATWHAEEQPAERL